MATDLDTAELRAVEKIMNGRTVEAHHPQKAAVTLDEYCALHPERKPIKLACFDIDGTLLSLDGHYSEQVKKSLKRVQSLGVKTAIASGRPYFATQFLWEELGLVDVGVFCTGAQIFEPKSQVRHHTCYLPADVVERLIETLRESDLYYELYTDDAFYIEHDRAPHILKTHSEHLRQSPIRCSLDNRSSGVVKLLIGADISQDENALKRIEKAYPECIFAYAALPAYPNWIFASIIDQSACKKTAFNYLLKHYDLAASEVISFGDAQSDKVFLSEAGIGVAMGNASEDVKAVANIVTAPVWENGVANALDALVVDTVMV